MALQRAPSMGFGYPVLSIGAPSCRGMSEELVLLDSILYGVG
jgi:hypothetical protein